MLIEYKYQIFKFLSLLVFISIADLRGVSFYIGINFNDVYRKFL